MRGSRRSGRMSARYRSRQWMYRFGPSALGLASPARSMWSAPPGPKDALCGWQGRRVGGTRSPALYASPDGGGDGRPPRKRCEGASRGPVAGLLALPVPGPDAGTAGMRMKLAAGRTLALAVAIASLALAGCGSGGGPAPAGAGGASLPAGSAPGPGMMGAIWAWRWVSLRQAHLHGAARSAREHGHRDACRYGDDPDHGRSRPAGSAHDAAAYRPPCPPGRRA